MFGRSKTPDPVRRPLPDAGERVASSVQTASTWTLRLLILAVGLWLLGWLTGVFWTVVLPLLLALLLSSILWPPVKFLRKFLPPALAAIIGVVMVPVLFAGLVWLTTVLVAGQWDDLAQEFGNGIDQVQSWLAGPPFNLDTSALDTAIDDAINYAQSNAGNIGAAALTSLATVGSLLVTLVLTLVLSFFILKDGTKFLPWVRTWTGGRISRHVAGLSERVWNTLGVYMWNQAGVALIDAVFIGLGAWLLGVPFPIPIAILTFLGGFIPIVGAFAAGIIAVLVALVSEGLWIAVAMLVIVVLVQQIEGNVIQPLLLGNSLKMHASVVLVSVAAGGTLFGIIGALLAVPAASVIMVTFQYIRDQVTVPGDEPAPVEVDPEA